MKTLKIECQLDDAQIQTIAQGLGWSSYKTEIDENGAWSNVPNDQTCESFIMEHFTGYITNKVAQIYVDRKRQELLDSVNPQIATYETTVKESVAQSLVTTIA